MQSKPDRNKDRHIHKVIHTTWEREWWVTIRVVIHSTYIFFCVVLAVAFSFLHSYVLFFLRHVPDMLFGLSLFGRKQQFFSPVRVTSKRLFFPSSCLIFWIWAWIKSHQILSILHLKVIVEIFFFSPSQPYPSWMRDVKNK